VNPGSKVQLELQPSFETAFPCSQVSEPTLIKSPQVVWQMSGDIAVPPEQVHPLKVPEQAELHPLASLTPSSQSSAPHYFPSPHKGVQMSGTAPLQIHPVS